MPRRNSCASTLVPLVMVLAIMTMTMNVVNAMDHSLFKKCADKNFCHQLRHKIDIDEYDLHSIVPHHSPSPTTPSSTTVLGLLWKKKQQQQQQQQQQQKTETENEQQQQQKQDGDDHLLMEIDEPVGGVFRVRMREQVDEKDIHVMDKEMPRRRPVKDVITVDDSQRKEFLVEGELPHMILRSFTGARLHIDDNKISLIMAGEFNDASITFNAKRSLHLESVTHKNASENAIRGAHAMDFTFHNTKHIYGIPERAVDLTLKETTPENEPYRLYNLDVFRYELDNTLGLYGAIPLMWSLSNKGQASAVFVLNPSEMFVDIGKDADNMWSHWIAETGMIEFYLLHGPDPKQLISQYVQLTGLPALPQMFSLAYHQCRWNYKDEEDVLMINDKYDEFDMPLDVIWLDIEHTDGKRYFTWDSHLFPHPEEMQQRLKERGRKLVTISDPHIKRAPGYPVFDEATSRGLFIKNEHGNDYEGDCWPGKSSWLDFADSNVRSYYAGLFAFDKYKGSTNVLYTWIDMNEPSVFGGQETVMHKEAKHLAGQEHRELHNMYGFYHSMATYDGLIKRHNPETDRPFILTRSFFSGSQRYAAVWTGDNEANWGHIAKAQPMLLTLGISGIPFVGADVGGFFDNPDSEMLTRWYQAGAFYPFFRAHGHIETARREPWLFGDDALRRIRNAIVLRYRLLPYFYTLAHHASLAGTPLMRPLWMEWPSDPETFSMQDQFLVGNALMVKPISQKEQTEADVYLPKDDGTPWYDWTSGVQVGQGSGGQVHMSAPIDRGIPVLQRGGTIVPTKYRARRSSPQMFDDPYTLHIALDAKGDALGDLYIDDGHSFEYRDKGAFIHRLFTVRDTKLITCEHAMEKRSQILGVENLPTGPQPSEDYHVNNTVERIVLYGYPHHPQSVLLGNENSVKIVDAHQDQFGGDQNIIVRQSLTFDYDKDTKVLIIHSPNVKVAEDWQIEIVTKQ